MGRPIITSDVPGCREVVEHNVSGWLCEVKNVESLTNAFERFLLLDKASRRAMGQAGCKKMQREFADGLVVGIYATVMRELNLLLI